VCERFTSLHFNLAFCHNQQFATHRSWVRREKVRGSFYWPAALLGVPFSTQSGIGSRAWEVLTWYYESVFNSTPPRLQIRSGRSIPLSKVSIFSSEAVVPSRLLRRCRCGECEA
jgi:hypothetical protein